jgi:hypothetical protein
VGHARQELAFAEDCADERVADGEQIVHRRDRDRAVPDQFARFTLEGDAAEPSVVVDADQQCDPGAPPRGPGAFPAG